MNATAPAVNIKEDENAYTMEIAAPGLKKDMVNINSNVVDLDEGESRQQDSLINETVQEQRRSPSGWLIQCNPLLTSQIENLIGTGFHKDAAQRTIKDCPYTPCDCG